MIKNYYHFPPDNRQQVHITNHGILRRLVFFLFFLQCIQQVKKQGWGDTVLLSYDAVIVSNLYDTHPNFHKTVWDRENDCPPRHARVCARNTDTASIKLWIQTSC